MTNVGAWRAMPHMTRSRFPLKIRAMPHIKNNTKMFRKFGHPIKQSLSTIIGAYKSAVTKEINKLRNKPGRSVWQRNYYEHIIRNEKELFAVRQYIIANPKKLFKM